MEAHKNRTKKYRRKSDLSFEPSFTLTIGVESDKKLQAFDPTIIVTSAHGVDRCNPWTAPNHGFADSITQVGHLTREKLKFKVTFANYQSVIGDKHVDAYLRYIQGLGDRLFEILNPHGVDSVCVVLHLYAYVSDVR